MLLNILKYTKQPPDSKNDLARNVSSVEDAEACFREQRKSRLMDVHRG